MRVAFSSMLWNTGSRSPADRLMTLSTSDVAVCCSSDSESSRVRACTSSNSRTLPIAITAWSAKVCSRAICLSLNGRTSVRRSTIDADALAFAQQWHAQHGANAGSGAKIPAHAGNSFAFGSEQVMHVDRRAVDDRATGGPVAIDGLSSQTTGIDPCWA